MGEVAFIEWTASESASRDRREKNTVRGEGGWVMVAVEERRRLGKRRQRPRWRVAVEVKERARVWAIFLFGSCERLRVKVEMRK